MNDRYAMVGAVMCTLAAVSVPGTAQASPMAEAQAHAAIAAVLDTSAKAWSAGDLDRFMASYANAPSTTYLSGPHLVHGYDAIRAMYAARFGGGTQAAMGELTIDIVDFRLLDPNHAYVIGHFQLHRDTAHGGDAQGPTTLVFERTAAGWRIIADHS